MKTKLRTVSIGEAIDDSYSELAYLGEECREVAENMPESLQNSSRYESLSESGDTLVGLEPPTDVPDDIAAMSVSFQQYIPPGKRQLSRATRRDNATMALQAIVEVLSNMEEHVVSWHIADAICEAEACEFPGMYG